MSIQEANLKAIADVIREKDGTTEPIPANDFPARIRAISSVPDGLRTITLTADPPEGGTVSGGGLASDGMVVTVKAEATEGYNSAGWQENGADISEEPEYTFPVQGDKELVAVFNVKPASRLPDGYTEVEYIQSNGTEAQYINTGVRPPNAALVIDFEPLNPGEGATSKYVVQSSYAPASSTASKYFFLLTWTQDGLKVSTRESSVHIALFSVLSSNTTPRRMVAGMDAPNRRVFLLGETELENYAFTSYYNMSNILLLSSSSATYALAAKLYSCQISTSGELVRDFVPCIDPTGAVGLFDLVNEQFYPNAGTGAFTAGPAV